MESSRMDTPNISSSAPSSSEHEPVNVPLESQPPLIQEAATDTDMDLTSSSDDDDAICSCGGCDNCTRRVFRPMQDARWILDPMLPHFPPERVYSHRLMALQTSPPSSTRAPVSVPLESRPPAVHRAVADTNFDHTHNGDDGEPVCVCGRCDFCTGATPKWSLLDTIDEPEIEGDFIPLIPKASVQSRIEPETDVTDVD